MAQQQLFTIDLRSLGAGRYRMRNGRVATVWGPVTRRGLVWRGETEAGTLLVWRYDGRLEKNHELPLDLLEPV